MATSLEVDICVLGAGAGGLVVAAAAAMLDVPVALVEKGRMGGDCLNYGCIPSKSLIAAAAAAAGARRGHLFGVAAEPRIDFARLHDHIGEVIAAIAPHDSAERFEGLGCTVIRAPGRFVGPREVAAGEVRIRARRFVIATGSSPAPPPIPGLETVPYLTNETVFDLAERPDRLVVVGGGPVGVEIAQAYRRLGVAVSVLETADILGREDPEIADVVRQRLVREGVEVAERVAVEGIAPAPDGGVRVTFRRGGEDSARETLTGSHLLVAAGRRANIDDLGLEAAGIERSGNTLKVDRRLRTTNRRVYAIGDVAGPYQFTHLAAYHAGIVVRNALFRLPAKADHRAIPRVTYTDPEIAAVGLDEAAARRSLGAIRVLRWSFAENHRARAERRIDGFAKVVTTPGGRVLGAAIVGPHAGEIIQPWVLAVARRMKVGALAEMVVPYPTLGEINRSVAGSFYTAKIFSPRMKRLVRFLRRLG